MSVVVSKMTKKRRHKDFSEMNLAIVGITGLTVMLVLLAGALNIGKILELVGQSPSTVELTETGGLHAGDDVRVAGLTVGKVRGIKLEGDHVKVTFGIGNVRMGDQTRAEVKSDNALGSKFLAIEPAGSGDLKKIDIPVSRSDPGFAVNEELGKLTRNLGQVDSRELAKSFESLSTVLNGSDQQFGAALKGVSRLAQTVASRNGDLQTLLTNAEGVSGLLEQRNRQITAIMADGGKLFGALAARRQALSQMLRDTIMATHQLSGLANDNKDQLKPAMEQLGKTADLLNHYRGTLNMLFGRTSGYLRSLGEAIASGPFFNAYVENLTAPEDLGVGGISGLLAGGGGN